jgi:hypothetical protein
MQRFFSVIIIFAILFVGGGYLFMKKSEEEAKVKLADDLASARRSFADRARSAALEQDDKDYARSIQASIKGYDEELKKRVYNKKPEWRDPAAYEKDVEERFKKGELQEAQRKSMLEGYNLVKGSYDTIMAANWKPVLTAVGQGDIRLDIYELKRAKDDEGNPVLEGRFFFWGLEDNTRVTWGQLAMRFWTTEMQQVKEGKKMVEKEVEKVLGRAEGDATPRIIIPSPGKYIEEYPSNVQPGFIWLPVMPREAKFVDIEYSFTAKKGGGSYDVALKWEKLPIPAQWKLGEGEVWEADVIEATEEEIAGKDGNTDPADGAGDKKEEEK